MKDKKLAVITGASSGIGKSFAYILASRGYDLILVARRKTLLMKHASALRKRYNVAVKVYDVDLSIGIQRKKLLSLLHKKKESIDLLINNAGLGRFGEAVSIGAEDTNKMIEVNVVALTEFCLSLIPLVLKSNKKSIINVASVASFHPSAFAAVYAATKAYVYSFSMALASEYNGKISILALCPGIIDTEFWQSSGVSKPKYLIRSADKVVEQALQNLTKKVLIIGVENKIRVIVQKFIPDSFMLYIGRAMRTFIQKQKINNW